MIKYDIRSGVKKIKTKTSITIGGAGLAGVGLIMALFMPLAANAANPTYTLFGDATLVHPGNASQTAVQEIWSPSQPFGGVDFGIPSGLTVSGLNNLSTDYKFTDGTCSQGSPRFQINVLGKNVFVYLGPQFPSVNPCAGATYSNSTNVISPVSLVDATQLGNGYETWAAFQAQHSTDTVTGIQLVVDGFTTPNITAQFDNTMINDVTYTYEAPQPQTKDDCKNGGWQSMQDANGNSFKNQGDCVSYVATGGKNPGAVH